MKNGQKRSERCSNNNGISERIKADEDEQFRAEASVGMAFRCVNNLLKRYYCNTQVIKECEQITGMHGYILGYLYYTAQKGDVFQRDIENEFEMRRSTATEMLQLMARNGLIERHSVEYDARLKKIVLTPLAHTLHERMTRECRRADELMVQGISENELNVFFGVMEKIKANILGIDIDKT